MADTGRPTIYNEDMQMIADDYINNYEDHNDAVPSVVGLACLLGVTKQTLYNWSAEHPRFLDTLDKIKATQENKLTNGGLRGDFNSTITKLMLANHGYHEKQEVDHKGIDNISVVVTPVDNGNTDTAD